MKVVIAFTVLLLAASGFELTEELNDEELFNQIAEDMKEISKEFTVVDSTDLMRGDWEVAGMPYIVAAFHRTRAS